MKKIFFFLVVYLAAVYFIMPAGSASSDNDWEYQLKKYARIYSLIQEYYPGEFDVKKLFFTSIEGFLRGLDPHSYFLDPVSLRSLNEDQQGNYYGIGTRVTKYEDRLTVVDCLAGAPAHKLGITVGDIIIEIDGRDTADMSLDEAMRNLRGSKNTYVNIKIKRVDVEKPISARIKRAEIPLDSITYAVIHPEYPGVGCIGVRTFGSTTAEELRKNIDRLKKKENMKALILDLRWNAGGSLYAAVETADFFLEKGKTIVSIKGKIIDREFTAKKDNQYEELPAAVLINRVSASASEIAAAALQDHKRALLIGSRSWGKGLVQTVYKLSLNASTALTTAKYYTPGNRCLQRDFTELDDYFSILSKKDYDHNTDIKGGVTPDIFVEEKETADIIVDLISKGIFFRFSRRLIEADHDITKDFKTDDRVIKRFKDFLKENKFEYDEEHFTRHLADIKNMIEREVVTDKFSSSEGIKVFLRDDPVSGKAAAILTEALKKDTKNRWELLR